MRGFGTSPKNIDSRARAKASAPSGLALIEALYFGSGLEPARHQFQQLLGPEQLFRSFAISEKPQAGLEKDSVAAGEVSYQNFSPPLSWNAPYTLQAVRFGKKHKGRDEYTFHSGEELLIPLENSVEYAFFWSPGGRLPDATTSSAPTLDGTILRINPQIPHLVQACREEATAWMVLRHGSNSSVTLTMDQESGLSPLRDAGRPAQHVVAGSESSSSPRVPLRRRVTSAELRNPGTYAMIAWGISESIREARQRTGRTTTDLANQIGIDPSSLWRIEEARTNVSIEMLARIARSLRIGLADSLASGSWTHERGVFASSLKALAEPVLGQPLGTHRLHPYLLQMPAGEESKVLSLREGGGRLDALEVSSWIVLKGRVLLELPPELGSKAAIVDAGNVLHFREPGMISVRALQESTIIQIEYSHTCGCRSQTAASRAGG